MAPEDDSSGLLIVLIIALIVVLVCIVGFAVIGWRYYATKPCLDVVFASKS